MPDSTPCNGLLNLSHLPAQGKFLYVPDSQLGMAAGWEFLSLPNDMSLFQGLPCAGEISQEGIGNCYLISALLAIADHPKGPEFIQHMIIRLSPTRVVVRLYHYVSPADIIPVFYELDATILQRCNPQLNSYKAPWVYFIEKAYAAHRLKFGGDCYRALTPDGKISETSRKPNDQVEALCGGFSSDAFEILLGKKAERIRLGTVLGKTNKLRKTTYDFFSNFMQIDRVMSQTDRQDYFVWLFRSLYIDYTTPKERVHAINLAISDLRNNISQEAQDAFRARFNPDKTIRIEEFEYYINIYFACLKLSTREALLQSMSEILPSKRGLGRYLPSDFQVYDMIHQALTKKRMVCISTSLKMGTQQASSTVQFIVKGIAMCHSYQVLNCYERAGLKILLIRDPQHKYVREYNHKPWKCKESIQDSAFATQHHLIDYRKTVMTLEASAATNRPFEPIHPGAPIERPAIPFDYKTLDKLRFKDHGVCEIMLEDFIKCFVEIHIGSLTE